jgi:hypothetical protein
MRVLHTEEPHGGAIDVALVGVARLHRAHAPLAHRVDEPPPRRRQAGGGDDRRDRPWRTNVVALGITTDGVKIPLGLWEGSTENAAVATALLSDLVERGLDPMSRGSCS